MELLSSIMTTRLEKRGDEWPYRKKELPHHKPRGYGRDELRRKLLVFSFY